MPSALSKRKTNWGVVLTTAAAIGNNVLPLPVPPFWKPVIGAVAWSTVVLCCVAWALTHFTWLARVRFYLASRKRMAFVLVFFVAGLVGVSIYWVLEKSNAESPQVAATHIETANAFEITGQINSAAPLQKDDVARGYLNGRVDWKVGLASVKPVRGDPQNIEAIFSPTSERPPNHPLISCVVAKKGHEYLGTMVQRSGELPVFRIKGVLTEIDYEHEHMAVSDASIEQLPQGEETTALTNDQLAKKAQREKQGESPSPSAQQKTPLEDGPKNVPPEWASPNASKLTQTEGTPPREVGPRVVPPNQPKVVVEANDIFALFADRNALQVIDLLEPHKGEFIETTGKIGHVGRSGQSDILIVLTNQNTSVMGCVFNQRWKEKLRDCKTGDTLHIRGKIGPYQDGNHLQLVECELL